MIDSELTLHLIIFALGIIVGWLLFGYDKVKK